ncbi:hypothetical protein E2C01_004213 [Portunus trituberculatus]|uniref:Uncharacterized protein n=1 Tax=Portunus trituberculatus TaxID=210409 RepID=A0A5B7CTF0_PORTR|nr:hypothetical protein [Portunus trituberculatus]
MARTVRVSSRDLKIRGADGRGFPILPPPLGTPFLLFLRFLFLSHSEISLRLVGKLFSSSFHPFTYIYDLLSSSPSPSAMHLPYFSFPEAQLSSS